MSLASVFSRKQMRQFADAAAKAYPTVRTETLGLDDDSQAALVMLASLIEPDGGMSGKTDEERVLATILTLLQFLAAGNSETTGTFRAHVKRLLEFLEKAKVRPEIVKQVVERARSGRALEGDWSKRLPEPGLWRELEDALNN